MPPPPAVPIRPMPPRGPSALVRYLGANDEQVLDAAHAGHSRLTLVTPDIDAARADLAKAGLTLGQLARTKR